MTIRRRLFWSNILMIIIPVFLSLLVTGVILFVSFHLLGGDTMQRYQTQENSHRVYSQIETMADKWTAGATQEQVRQDMEDFQNLRESDTLSLLVYEDETLLHSVGSAVDPSLLETALLDEGEHTHIRDNLFIRTFDAGSYRLLLVNHDFFLEDDLSFQDYRLAMLNVILLLLALVVIIILVTNRLLTRHVFRSITTPLDTLVYGVHQIRDGNLDYRIEYGGKDEFAQVVSDFNEIAQRLLEMVNARQKDDESRRELIAGISHDLRTPLTSIKAYVEGLEKGVATNPQMEKMYLDTIKSKADDLDHIVTQLFQFSKLDVGEYPFHMEQLEMGELIRDYTARVQLEYNDKGMSIELAECASHLLVEVDAVQLKNVFTNLLENARKYGKQQDGVVHISCSKDGNYAKLSFADNGPGVSPETVDRMFDLFYRNDKARTNPSQGSGLGLAIAKKIVERFGGSIQARNSEEGGLCVEIKLPVKSGVE